MKNIKIALLTGLIMVGFGSYAQGQIKLGHIDSNQLLTAMPESDSAQKTLQAERAQIEETLDQLQVELRQKYDTYIQNEKTYSDLIKTTKMQEIQQMDQRIQEFQMNAEQQLRTRSQQLMMPIHEKAKKAIDEVAAENGFTYIFDIGTGAIVYAAENTEDILPLVKKKLGLE